MEPPCIARWPGQETCLVGCFPFFATDTLVILWDCSSSSQRYPGPPIPPNLVSRSSHRAHFVPFATARANELQERNFSRLLSVPIFLLGTHRIDAFSTSEKDAKAFLGWWGVYNRKERGCKCYDGKQRLTTPTGGNVKENGKEGPGLLFLNSKCWLFWLKTTAEQEDREHLHPRRPTGFGIPDKNKKTQKQTVKRSLSFRGKTQCPICLGFVCGVLIS